MNGEVRLVRTMVTLAGLVLLALVGCRAQKTPKPEPTGAPPHDAPSRANRAAAGGGPAVTGLAPTLSLRVVGAKAGLGLRVINAGTQRVSLNARIVLMPEEGEKPLSGPSLVMQTDCSRRDCVTLAPGAEIDAPLWLERSPPKRCGALLTPNVPGHYRLRVKTCDGRHAVDAEVSWPPP